MNTILVVGIETTVGANMAAHLAETHSVVGLSCGRPLSIDGCDCHDCGSESDRDPADWLETASFDHVVYCGPEARSSWEPASDASRENRAHSAAAWATAAAAAKTAFTMISSDAVFTGPWIFHDEESLALCRTPDAAQIRETEQAVRNACPEALVIRTNAFGWSPEGSDGWIENLLEQIESRADLDCDYNRHATPILATDLADIIERAWQEEISGIHHVAGAERVSPLQFAQRLADQFEMSWLRVRREPSAVELPEGVAARETSLQTKKVRKALCVAMPMLSEGLHRLHAQDANGFRDRVCGGEPARIARVA